MAKQVVVFKLLDQEYSIDIMKVLEILNYEPVRAVPNVPKYIEGMVNVRGTIYPIFNLRERLHLQAHELMSQTKFILLNLEEIKVGFMVDNVCEILNVAEEEVDMTPKMITKYDNKFIEGVINKDDRMILILNVELLLTDDEVENLETLQA